MSDSTLATILRLVYYAGFGIAFAVQLSTKGAKLCNDTVTDIVKVVAAYFIYMAAYILLYPFMIHHLSKNRVTIIIGVLLKVITQLILLVHLALFYALGSYSICPNVSDVLRVWFFLVGIVTLLIVARLLVTLLSYILHSKDLEELFPKIPNPIVWVIGEISNISDSGKWTSFLTKVIYYIVFAIIFFTGLDKAHETTCYQPNYNYFKAATYYFIYMAVVTTLGHVSDLTGFKRSLDHNCLTRTLYAFLFLPVQLTPIIYVALLKMSGRSDDCSAVYDAVKIWFMFVCAVCGLLTARDIYHSFKKFDPENVEHLIPKYEHHDHHDHHAILV